MNPLHLPLTALPGPVPVGAPVVWRGESGWTVLAVTRDVAFIVQFDRDSGMRSRWEPLSELGLDLTAPPLDAQGHPTRIDGADIAAGMLARAMGLGLSSVGGAAFAAYYPGGWFLAGDEWAFFHAPGVQGLGDAIVIPALADIDPDHPDVARLALVAVIPAKPWETC